MAKLVLLRHGQSVWNKEKRFTGWTDVGLTPRGEEEAREAGRLLREADFIFDHVYASVLLRSIKTLWLALEELGQFWVPATYAWQLNERHYGALQGRRHVEVIAEKGKEYVQRVRRSYFGEPPLTFRNDFADERRYESVKEVPYGESLRHTYDRVIPYWESDIRPRLVAGEDVLVSAHGNSLRALIKELDGLSYEEVVTLEIATGVPLVYEFKASLRQTSFYSL